MAVPAKAAAPWLIWRTPDSIRVRRGDFAAADPAVSGWDARIRTSAVTGPPAVAAGAWRTTTGLDLDAPTAQFSALAAGTSHDIQIRAVNSDGNGAWSDTLAAETQEEDTMTILQADLTEVQIGLEAAAGTLVAATRKVPYYDGATFEASTDWEEIVERGDVRAATTDVAGRRGSQLVLPQALSVEALIPALECSMANVSSAALSGARRWQFNPSVTAPSGLATATVEVAATDGAAHHLRRRFGFARCTAMSVDLSARIAKLDTTWMGRRAVALAAPAAVSAPPRWIIPSALFSVYIDDTWATRGTTQVGTVKSGTWTFDPGLTGVDDSVAGRSDLDTAYWVRDRLAGNLALTVEHDSDASDEFAHYEAGDLRYVRLEASNGAAGAALRRARIDMCCRWIATPNLFETDGDRHTLSLSGELRANEETPNNWVFAAVDLVCGLTTW